MSYFLASSELRFGDFCVSCNTTYYLAKISIYVDNMFIHIIIFGFYKTSKYSVRIFKYEDMGSPEPKQLLCWEYCLPFIIAG
jgi:hypothetical protein